MKMTVQAAISFLEQYELELDQAIVIDPWYEGTDTKSVQGPFKYSRTQLLFFQVIDTTCWQKRRQRGPCLMVVISPLQIFRRSLGITVSGPQTAPRKGTGRKRSAIKRKARE